MNNKLCPGRKADHPLFPVWHTECINCQHRMALIKEDEQSILPWSGHGPCPDQKPITYQFVKTDKPPIRLAQVMSDKDIEDCVESALKTYTDLTLSWKQTADIPSFNFVFARAVERMVLDRV